MRKPDIKSLYYITHIENLPSILQRGILSHKKVEELGVSYTPIYDSGIVSKRKDKFTPAKSSLWEYANLYFQPRNPMMYRVVHEKDKRDIAVIGVKPDVLAAAGGLITDGNAANDPTQFFAIKEGREILQKQWKIIQNEWWNDLDGSKRKIMAECLVPKQISPELVHSIFVADYKAKERVETIIGSAKIPVVPEQNMFFQPISASRIGTNISLIDGDMFFSNMQTLTISVNLQGIMGKGLASRAKYQFPDVYVVYQDACRNKQLTATKPYLYKREASLDQELADLSFPLVTSNAVKWFLSFATKRQWRDNSRLEDIEGGLDWVRNNCHEIGIQSLAMPALGCGLGNLNWEEVGPLMCRSLHNIGIPVAIYLPREHQIDSKYLTNDYLLNRS
ncbi:Appr-1-p processing protein [Nostoc sp. 'Peltigera membranacea cyanobiont' 210A]|uniref:DarT ssDNA thymidine ADP-ribosyltransferase family protein n=1 Tax=Nostoc sp. 'Peltigera membranacea cyanobiont' 210A TaxID=2014529 RepID=UPI000B95BD11|nr:DarT ssDNA thymidine ADP-ribosyltransferase family protein [Nostoc sp. 'Peltigera membranacea cyanobiont' 210A]OYD90555.1 Appr-1-p processing protein [Nostoc sp. 'Peltigera membranacea cyanobiont' 210A]